MVFAPGVPGRCCWLRMDAEGRETCGHDLGSAPKDRSLHPGGNVWAGLGGSEVGEGSLKIRARPGSPFQRVFGISGKCRESSLEEEDQRSKAADE